MKKNTSIKEYKKIVDLSEVRFIFQPNRITDARYDYSLIQERLLNAVLLNLQYPIKLSSKGEQYSQLSLFSNNLPYIQLIIPLNEIATPSQYKFVRESIQQLVGIVVAIPFKKENSGRNWVRFDNLMKAEIPDKKTRSAKIIIEIDKRVASKLIEIETNEKNIPINYTRFGYEIAQKSKCRYTSKIYKLLCSYKKKGKHEIPIDEFRKWLCIEDKYPEYRDIKRHILLPVQEELFETADCWFDCNEKNFIRRNKYTVTHLNFRIITPIDIEKLKKHRDNIKYLLKYHFQLTDTQINELADTINNKEYSQIANEILDLRHYINNNKEKIENINSYVFTALKNNLVNNYSQLPNSS